MRIKDSISKKSQQITDYLEAQILLDLITKELAELQYIEATDKLKIISDFKDFKLVPL